MLALAVGGVGVDGSDGRFGVGGGGGGRLEGPDHQVKKDGRGGCVLGWGFILKNNPSHHKIVSSKHFC